MSRDYMRPGLADAPLPVQASGGAYNPTRAPLMPAEAAAEYAMQQAAVEDATASAMAARDAARVRHANRTTRPTVAAPDETSMGESLRELAAMGGLEDEYDTAADVISSPAMAAIMPGAAAANALGSVRYSPGALASGFTDSATFGHAGEIGGLVDHVLTGQDYDQSAAEQEAIIAQQYERAPGSAMAGTIGGMVPIAAAGGGLGAAGTGSLPMRALRMIRPAAAIGATAGAVGGGLTADEGEALEGAGYGALEGLGAAVPAAAMGAAGAGVRALGQSAGLVGRMAAPVVAGGLTGAGYGYAGAHGAPVDSAPVDADAWITDPTTRHYLGHTGMGAALGAPLEAAGSMVGAGLRAASRARPAVDRGPIQSAPPGIVDDLDEAALLWGDGAPAGAVEASAVEGFRTPEQLAEQARASDPRSAAGAAFSSLFEAPPEYDRLFSVSATGPGTARQLRAGSNAFGGPANWVRELQKLGLAREGSVYSRPVERAAVERTRDALGTQARGYHSAVEATGTTTPGATIADVMEADAAALRSRSTAPEVQAAADALEARAQRIRFTTSEMPGLEGVESAQVPRDLSYRDVLNELAEQGRLNNEAYSSPLVSSSLTPSQRSGINVYRALAESRNRMAEQALGPEQYANMRNTMRGFQATNAVSPVNLRLDINAMHQPANLRGAMGGMSAQLGSAIEGGGILDQGLSRVAGQAKENLIAAYQHSLRAAANERLLPEAMRRLNAMGIDPATAARISESLGGQTPGLAAMAGLRARDMGDAAFGSVDSAATARAEADEQEGAYENAGADFLDSLTGVSTAPDAGIPESMDPEEDVAHQRGADYLDSILGVSTADDEDDDDADAGRP